MLYSLFVGPRTILMSVSGRMGIDHKTTKYTEIAKMSFSCSCGNQNYKKKTCGFNVYHYL